MALTIANVPSAMSAMTEFPLGHFKARIVDITFDNSYLTGGEVVNATDLGWNAVYGAIQITGVGNANGTLSVDVVVRPNSTNTALAFQAQEGGSTANDNPFKEVTSLQDLSAFTGRFLIFGH